MARSRNIKPSFFSNELLAECDPLGRLLFIGLWCIADREGRIEERHKRIKAELFAYDSCDIGALIDGLVEREFLVRFEFEGRKYLQILNWHKHQAPHYLEPDSSIIAPESVVALCAKPVTKKRPSKHRRRTKRRSSTDELNQESGIRNQESAIRNPQSAADISIPPAFDTREVRIALDQWLEYKRSKGQTYKDARHLEHKFAEFDSSVALVAAIKFSIGNNYSGIFRDKAGSVPTTGRHSGKDYRPATIRGSAQ